MIEYQIKHEQSIYSLERAVNAAIRDGWGVFGDLQVIVIRGKRASTKELYQPMIRTILEPELR